MSTCIACCRAAASSSASDSVGYGLGSQIGLAAIGPFSIAPGDTLLRYTLDGDANLDHAVDSTDFNVLRNDFGLSGVDRADFDYNLVVNSSDFNILKGNFGQSGHNMTCP